MENTIKEIIEINLDLCQSDTYYNDEFIHDLLRYGFKGLENMTPSELATELEALK